MGDSVEIKKIQSSKSKVQNKFQTPNPKFKTIALKSRINFFFQTTTIAHVSRREGCATVTSVICCLKCYFLKAIVFINISPIC